MSLISPSHEDFLIVPIDKFGFDFCYQPLFFISLDSEGLYLDAP